MSDIHVDLIYQSLLNLIDPKRSAVLGSRIRLSFTFILSSSLLGNEEKRLCLPDAQHTLAAHYHTAPSLLSSSSCHLLAQVVADIEIQECEAFSLVTEELVQQATL